MNVTRARGRLIEKCYKVISFVLSGRRFTIYDLMSHMGCSKEVAQRHFQGVSLYFPIAEIDEAQYGNGRGLKAAVYQYIKE